MSTHPDLQFMGLAMTPASHSDQFVDKDHQYYIPSLQVYVYLYMLYYPKPLIPCHTLSYPVIPCHTLSYPAIPCHTLPYPAIPCHTTSNPDTLITLNTRMIHDNLMDPHTPTHHVIPRYTSETALHLDTSNAAHVPICVFPCTIDPLTLTSPLLIINAYTKHYLPYWGKTVCLWYTPYEIFLGAVPWWLVVRFGNRFRYSPPPHRVVI